MSLKYPEEIPALDTDTQGHTVSAETEKTGSRWAGEEEGGMLKEHSGRM